MLYLFSFCYFSLAYGVMNKAWLAFTLKAAKQIFFRGERSEMGKGKGNKERGRMERKASFFFFKALGKLSAGLWLEATILISFIISSRNVVAKFSFAFLGLCGCFWMTVAGLDRCALFIMLRTVSTMEYMLQLRFI